MRGKIASMMAGSYETSVRDILSTTGTHKPPLATLHCSAYGGTGPRPCRNHQRSLSYHDRAPDAHARCQIESDQKAETDSIPMLKKPCSASKKDFLHTPETYCLSVCVMVYGTLRREQQRVSSELFLTHWRVPLRWKCEGATQHGAFHTDGRELLFNCRTASKERPLSGSQRTHGSPDVVCIDSFVSLSFAPSAQQAIWCAAGPGSMERGPSFSPPGRSPWAWPARYTLH